MFMLEGKTITVKVFDDGIMVKCMDKSCDGEYENEDDFYDTLVSLVKNVGNQLTYPLYTKGTKVRIKHAGNVFLNCANWVVFNAEHIDNTKLVHYKENEVPTESDCEFEYDVDYADENGMVFISTYLKNIGRYKCFVMAAEGLEIIENEEDN